MSFRFQRRIRIFPGVRLNLSKSGVSATVGPRGAHLTVGQQGASVTAGLPGTGMSWRQRVGVKPVQRSLLRLDRWFIIAMCAAVAAGVIAGFVL